ncbi:MAG: hypothetical protein ACTS6P_01755 [Candidatus Hodgkinia cicadicola]
MRPNEWFRRKRRIRSLAFANSEDSAACYYEMRESAFIRTCFPNVNVKHVLQLLTQPQLKGTMFNLSLMAAAESLIESCKTCLRLCPFGELPLEVFKALNDIYRMINVLNSRKCSEESKD